VKSTSCVGYGACCPQRHARRKISVLRRSDWYVSGDHDPRWNDDALGDLKLVPGSAFEAVYTGEILHTPPP